VLAAKAQRARTGIQAATLAGGRGIGLAAGALGAPRGGLAGLAARSARPHLAAAGASAAFAAGPPRPRPTGTSGRITKAGDALRDTPTRMRDAWRASGPAPAQPGASGAKGRGRAGGRKGGGQPRAAQGGSPTPAVPTTSRDSRRPPIVPNAPSRPVRTSAPAGKAADPSGVGPARVDGSETAQRRSAAARLSDPLSPATRPASRQPAKPQARPSGPPASPKARRFPRSGSAGTRRRKGGGK
jgi:hypothetical protein